MDNWIPFVTIVQGIGAAIVVLLFWAATTLVSIHREIRAARKSFQLGDNPANARNNK